MNPDDLRKADAIEVVVGQGAKPGGGGMLLGQKISDRVAEMRTLPKGIDQRSACRHPDWTGPDDLEIKILELREITDWEKPIYIKVGGARPYYDVALAVKSGADVVVLDGMQGGTAATQEVFIEHVGLPTLACIRPAVQALQDLGMHRKVQLIVSGGIRNGADVAKALALGADAVSIGIGGARRARRQRSGARKRIPEARHTTAGAYDDWHEGRDPAGITTQDPELVEAARSGARRAPPRQLSQGDDARSADHRARLRPQPRSQSRARRSLRADDRGRRDGARAARRHQLDTWCRRAVLTMLLPGSGRSSRDVNRSVSWEKTMSQDLASVAKERGIRYFMISYTDLFGGQRAKLVPAAAIADMQKDGAGFAGFATWLDMTPAHPDLFAHARSRRRDPAAVEEGRRLGRGRLRHGRQARCAGAARRPEEASWRKPRTQGLCVKTGVECEFFLIIADGTGHFRSTRTTPPSPATTSRR